MKPLLLITTCLLVSAAFAQKSPEIKSPNSDAALRGAASAAKATEAKNVTPDEAEKLITEGKVTVLDVRTPDEFKQGHIAGAVNIDISDADFAKKVGSLGKEKPVLVHCGSGGRSTRSLPVLEGEKFPTIYHMNGGFKAWTAAGKPVEKSAGK